jgi:hypothetical protein
MGRGKRKHARVPAHVILGLEEGAGLEEIRAAHVALSERFLDSDPDMYQAVQEAYEILTRRADGKLTLVSVKKNLKDLYAELGDEATLVGVRRKGMPKAVSEVYARTAVVAP